MESFAGGIAGALAVLVVIWVIGAVWHHQGH